MENSWRVAAWYHMRMLRTYVTTVQKYMVIKWQDKVVQIRNYALMHSFHIYQAKIFMKISLWSPSASLFAYM